MLGSLAKWLRILGYDVAYDNQINDEQILWRCLTEARTTLTRDTRLIQRRQLQSYLLIQSDHLLDQIGEVLDFLGDEIDLTRLLTRCLECNAILESVPKKIVHNQVPSYVYRTQSRFKRCPSCRKVYWGGTHRDHIHRRLGELLSAGHSHNKEPESGREHSNQDSPPTHKA